MKQRNLFSIFLCLLCIYDHLNAYSQETTTVTYIDNFAQGNTSSNVFVPLRAKSMRKSSQRGGNIVISNVTFHYPDEQYARTADNYLRGRLTYNLRHWDNLYSRYYNDCKCKYYALDYVPQKVEMNIAKEYEDSHLLDEYLRDIDIAMRNLEGATQVYVEQLEEGDLYPSVTAFSNFKSARYLATVDKEYASDFTVVSYNNNGHKTSEVLSVPAISPAQLYLNITGGRIIATYGHKRKRVKNMQYTILFSPNNSSSLTMAKWGNSIDGCIYLSDLENGLNIVKVTLPNGKTASIAVNK